MPSTVASIHLSPAELSYIHTSLSSYPPIRPDARSTTDFRPLNAETGVLLNTMGSAHVGFADGREAVVGVRVEVEKTPQSLNGSQKDVDQDIMMHESNQAPQQTRGKADWITLSLTLPGLRDDDKDLVFLEATLREALAAPSLHHPSSGDQRVETLQDALVINTRWHWHLYIDALLISPPETSSSAVGGSRSSSASTSPLPLLSMAIHFALRDTRIPRLKSEGEEDPIADDDWEASIHLFSPSASASASESTRNQTPKSTSIIKPGITPPITLLVMSVGENIIFDPSGTELSVADGIWAVSIASSATSKGGERKGRQTPPRRPKTSDTKSDASIIQILGIRMLETPARDTMKGVPRDTNPSEFKSTTKQTGQGTATTTTTKKSLSIPDHILMSGSDQTLPGVWKPRIGGVKRNVVLSILKAIVGGGTSSNTVNSSRDTQENGMSVGREILQSLDGFLTTNK